MHNLPELNIQSIFRVSTNQQSEIAISRVHTIKQHKDTAKWNGCKMRKDTHKKQ